jgi:hypothetical protein
MTSDKVKTALIAVLDESKPHSSITAADAQSFDETALPQLSVAVAGIEQHSLTLPGVQKIEFEIRLRAHAGDTDTRTAIDGWCDLIEQTINDPATMKSQLTAKAAGADVDHWLASGGVPEWDGSTLNIVWACDCWAVRKR